MPFDLKDLLQAVGPNASLVFAAWIFLSFLQSRYSAAFDRYRELAENYRHGPDGDRGRSLERMIVIYRRRCEVMRRATQTGVVSAMLLILTLVTGAMNVVFPDHAWMPPLAAVLAVAGLALVIVAASAVLVENRLISRALDEELADLPQLAEAARSDPLGKEPDGRLGLNPGRRTAASDR